VNDGTAFSLSDSKGKGKGKGKGGKANESTSDVEKMISALLNVCDIYSGFSPLHKNLEFDTSL
jgi:hypothetical protein